MIKYESGRQGLLLEIGIVQNPDDITIPEILDLLAHKGEIYLWQIKKLFSYEAGPTDTRLFVAKRNDKIISTIMLVEYSSVAILGHVYTVPEERQKGVSSILMKTLIDDFKKRTGLIITLITGYQTFSYNFYAKYGFIGLEETGIMYFPENTLEIHSDIYAANGASVRQARWDDYPIITDMTLGCTEFPIKVFVVEAVGYAYFETYYIYLMENREKDHEHCQMNVLVKSSNDFPVGLVTIMPDKTNGEKNYCLDAFIYPGYEKYLEELIQSVQIQYKTIAYVESNNALKINALQKAGFKRDARLPTPIQFRQKNFFVDIYSYK